MPDLSDTWYFKGNVYYALKQYEKADECYNQTLKINPDYPDIWFIKGNVAYALNKFVEALDCYEKALKIKPDSHAKDTVCMLGNTKLGSQRYSRILDFNVQIFGRE
jgi:tetratricopeptide (TPR) repeat protein